MKKLNKLNAGLLVVSMFGAVSVFAMDSIATDTMMKKDDAMMMKKEAMMNEDKMMKDDAMMVKKEMMSEAMAMKVTKRSAKTEVVKLQELLISKGLLTVPTGTKLGFYGYRTQVAFAKYKAMMMKGDSMMVKDKVGDKMMDKMDKMIGTGTDAMMKK